MSRSSAPAGSDPKRSWWIAASILLAVALVSAGFAALAYTPAAATACRSCHAMRSFAASGSHSKVACGSCHAPGVTGAVTLASRESAMLPRFVLSFGRGEVSGPVSVVDDAGCTSCHADIREGVVTRGGLRIRHSTCAPGDRRCVDCHGGVSHGKAERVAQGATMDGCLRCHDGATATAKCDACHAAKLQSDRLTRGPWATTHGPNWQQTHGLGDLKTCKACHPSDYCRRCHGIDLPHDESFPRTHGKTALKQRAQCVKCHDEKTFCAGCHGIQMPHPAAFLPAHSKIASGFADPLCARCHPRQTCDDCHASHTHPGRTDGTLGRISLPAVKQ